MKNLEWKSIDKSTTDISKLCKSYTGLLGRASVTALRTCVCMSACLLACGHIPNISIERTDFQIYTRAKANSCSVDELTPMETTVNNDRQGQAVHRRCRQITNSS